jgi:hypothetical protein
MTLVLKMFAVFVVVAAAAASLILWSVKSSATGIDYGVVWLIVLVAIVVAVIGIGAVLAPPDDGFGS